MNEEEKIHQMLYELFSLGDKTIGIQYFEVYEKEFAAILEKNGFDLYKIYHGKTLQELTEERNKIVQSELKAGDMGKIIEFPTAES